MQASVHDKHGGDFVDCSGSGSTTPCTVRLLVRWPASDEYSATPCGTDAAIITNKNTPLEGSVFLSGCIPRHL